MWLWLFDVLNITKPHRGTNPELVGEMYPFIFELPARDDKWFHDFDTTDFLRIEVIPTTSGLYLDHAKVVRNLTSRSG